MGRVNNAMGVPGLVVMDRDDLIRLVVGMQWVEAVTLQAIADEIDNGSMYGITPRLLSRLPPAVDIVDEWLGVRK